MLKFFNRLCSVHLLIYSVDSFTGLIHVYVCVCVSLSQAGIPHFILFCFVILHKYHLCFTNWNFVVTLCWANLLASFFFFFPITLAHFVSLCHTLVMLTIFQMFSLLLDFLWCSVLSDLWCYYFGSLKAQMMVSTFSNKVVFNLN